MQKFENIKTIGKTTETKTTKEFKATAIKNHREKKQLSDPCPLWPTWV